MKHYCFLPRTYKRVPKGTVRTLSCCQYVQ